MGGRTAVGTLVPEEVEVVVFGEHAPFEQVRQTGSFPKLATALLGETSPRLASHISGSSQNSNVGAPRGGRRLWSCSGGSFTTPRASSLSRRLRAAKSFNRPCLATHCHRWHNSRASRLRLHCEFPSIQPLSHLLSVADIRRPCNSISVSTSQRCHLRNLVVRPNHQHIRDAPLSGSWCVLGQTRRSHRGATMQALKHQAALFHQQTSSLPRRRWRAW